MRSTYPPDPGLSPLFARGWASATTLGPNPNARLAGSRRALVHRLVRRDVPSAEGGCSAHARDICQGRSLLVHAYCGSAGLGAVVAAPVLAASGSSASTPSFGLTDPSACGACALVANTGSRRSPRALPSCWRRHLPAEPFVWLPMSGRGRLGARAMLCSATPILPSRGTFSTDGQLIRDLPTRWIQD